MPKDDERALAPDLPEKDGEGRREQDEMSLRERMKRYRQMQAGVDTGEQERADAAAAAQPGMLDKRQLRTRINAMLMNQFEPDEVIDTSDPITRQKIFNAIHKYIAENYKLLSDAEVQDLATEMMQKITGLGVVEPLRNDPEVSEIMINGYQKILVEKNGKIVDTGLRFDSEQDLLDVCERIAQLNHKQLNKSVPMMDGRLNDGSRVNIIIDPCSLIGPAVTIRKFPKRWRMHDLVRWGSLTQEMADFLAACVQLRVNIVVSGGTGSGKTTFINALTDFIPDHLRIITIEDAPELQVEKPNLVPLQTKEANSEGVGAIDQSRLLKNCLRMRPDIIIVGECRAGETLVMLQAMNTGHQGSMTSAHANSPYDLISRLETMVLMSGLDLPIAAIRRQIGSAVQLIIQVERMKDGARRVTRLTEVLGYDEDTNRVRLRDLFVFVQEGVDALGRIQGRVLPCGVLPAFFEQFAASGIPVSPAFFGCDEAGRPLPGVQLAKGETYA